jgi:phosphoglycerate kinase
LENIRLFKGEKKCDLNFAKKLSSLGEVFVFEAFSVAHRKHTLQFIFYQKFYQLIMVLILRKK